MHTSLYFVAFHRENPPNPYLYYVVGEPTQLFSDEIILKIKLYSPDPKGLKILFLERKITLKGKMLKNSTAKLGSYII